MAIEAVIFFFICITAGCLWAIDINRRYNGGEEEEEEEGGAR